MWAASKDDALRVESPCGPKDGAEWRRSTSNDGLNPEKPMGRMVEALLIGRGRCGYALIGAFIEP